MSGNRWVTEIDVIKIQTSYILNCSIRSKSFPFLFKWCWKKQSDYEITNRDFNKITFNHKAVYTWVVSHYNRKKTETVSSVKNAQPHLTNLRYLKDLLFFKRVCYVIESILIWNVAQSFIDEGHREDEKLGIDAVLLP